MWQDGRLLVAGPDTTAQLSAQAAGTEYVGLRFRPGAAPPLLGVPASELLDARPDAAAIWGRRAAEVGARLEAVRSPDEVAAILQETVRRRLADAPPPDRAVERLVLALERGRAVRVDRLADEVGLSERQLLRQCRAALGYGPKTFAGIVRFQRFLADARRPGPGRLAEAARQSGYADQSHLTREVRRLSGLPPARLVAELAG